MRKLHFYCTLGEGNRILATPNIFVYFGQINILYTPETFTEDSTADTGT